MILVSFCAILQVCLWKIFVHCFHRFASEHRFWAPSEVEEEVENKEITEMLKTRYITFAGKFEPVKHKCRAPMPDGSLCERQDRIKVGTKFPNFQGMCYVEESFLKHLCKSLFHIVNIVLGNRRKLRLERFALNMCFIWEASFW